MDEGRTLLTDHDRFGLWKVRSIHLRTLLCKRLSSGYQVQLRRGQSLSIHRAGTPDLAVLETVYSAIKAGYRLFDGAGDYGNEKEAGEGLRRALKEGIVKREELCEFFGYYHSLMITCAVITSKVIQSSNPNPHSAVDPAFVQAVEHFPCTRACKPRLRRDGVVQIVADIIFLQGKTYCENAT